MALFSATANPTPFALFDSDSSFQTDADDMVEYVKLKLGDPILSVELTKKQIWAAFEESTAKFGAIANEYQAKSHLSTILGMSTGSMSALTNKFPRENLEWVMRMAEPYAAVAGLGGSYDTILGYIDLIDGQQNYNVYNDLKYSSGSAVFSSLTGSSKSKLRILDVFHFDPIAAQQFLLNASNITNFLATEFSFESYVNSTIFYVLPVFEDVLRRGMLDAAAKVRRSNYSYRLVGREILLYPTPVARLGQTMKLWIRVATRPDPINPDYQDNSIGGVSGLSNAPYGNLNYNTINSIGKRWIWDYTLLNCKEMLGLVRSKFKTIPIPGNDITLNGEELISQARDDKEKLETKLRETLDSLTYNKLLETDAAKAENLNKILKYVPIKNSIIIG